MEHRIVSILRLCCTLGLLLIAQQAWAQYPDSDDPKHVLIYKVNGKCSDTVQVTIHPTSVRTKWMSRKPCTVNLGIGVHYRPSNKSLLLFEGGKVFLLFGYHRDEMLVEGSADKYMHTPYGSYRATMKEATLIGNKLPTQLWLLKPDDGSQILLSLSPQLGVIKISARDKNRNSLGEIELLKVDGKLLTDWVAGL